MKYFIVDAETDGLYGDFLSVAVQVYEDQWNCIDEFYGAVRIESDQLKKKWVADHVYPYLYQEGNIYKTEEKLLNDFWNFWMKYQKEGNVCCIADVPYPVESSLFLKCVKHNIEEREFQAPFPFYDLESILRANGLKVLEDRETLLQKHGRKGFRRHFALDDVRMTAELLKIYWKKRE